MTLQEYQEYVRRETRPLMGGIVTDEVVDFVATSNALGGEVGELQNIVKKIARGGYFYDTHNLHDEFILEAGDVLHYFLRLLQAVNVDLDVVMTANVTKLEERKIDYAPQANSVSEIAPEPRVGEGSSVRDYQRRSLC